MSENMEKSALEQEIPAEMTPIEEQPQQRDAMPELPVAEEIQTVEPVAEEIPAVAAELAAEEIPATEAEPAAEEAPAAVAVAEPVAEAKPAKQRKIKKKRPFILRLLAGLVAFVLCIIMFAVTLTGALIVDLRVMTSQGGLEKLVTQLISPSLSEVPADRLDNTQLPADTMQDMTGALVDFVYAQLEGQFGEELPVTKEDVNKFLEESTAKDFLVEKVSGAVNDFVNGTSETTISAKEVAELLRENAPLVKETFGVEINEETIQEVETKLAENELLTKMEEQGIAGVMEETLEDALDDSGLSEVLASTGLGAVADTMNAAKRAMAAVRMVISNQAIAVIGGVLLVLILLVFLVNGTVPKSLYDVGMVMLLAGLILSAPNLLLANFGPELATMMPNSGSLLSLASGFLASVEVVHYSILGAGVALILLAIVAKIIKNSVQRKQAMA